MKSSNNQNNRLANIPFAFIYPLYIAKVEKKGRTKADLHQVIKWLTGYDESMLVRLIEEKTSLSTFFQNAKINPYAYLITGVICGYKIEDIEDPLTKQIRYLDKLVDELAKGKSIEKIFRKP